MLKATFVGVFLALLAGIVVTPQPASANPLAGIAAISGGCALTTTGGLKCWGLNTYGRLGDGTLAPIRTTPVDVVGLTSGAAAVSEGGLHTCALTTAGGVKCWGYNSYGQLGNGTTVSSNTPVDVSGPAGGVSAVSAGGQHTCAITTSGGLKCWGWNGHGQLGDGQACGVVCTTPVDVVGLTSGVAAVAAGERYTCAVTTAGGVECWGYNLFGQLGDGSTTDRTTPVDVSGLTSGVAAVAAASSQTCAVTMAGGLKCWGANGYGELGNGTNSGPQLCGGFPCSTAPVDVVGLTSGAAAVSAGGLHTCALTTAGGVKCWGANGYGELGNGTSSGPELCENSAPPDCSTTPVDVVELTSVAVAVSAGGIHSTCALTTEGGVKCWGYNAYGQVGDGQACGVVCTAPVDVAGLKPTPTATATLTPTPTPPPPVGGISLDPSGGALPSAMQQSSPGAWLGVGVIAGVAAGAVVLGSAVWYTQRRRLRR